MFVKCAIRFANFSHASALNDHQNFATTFCVRKLKKSAATRQQKNLLNVTLSRFDTYKCERQTDRRTDRMVIACKALRRVQAQDDRV